MDEELSAREPEHEPVPPGAADQVTSVAAAQPGRMPAIYLGHGPPPRWATTRCGWSNSRRGPAPCRGPGPS